MSKALKKKEAIVQEIEEKIDQSKSIVLVNYRGLTVDEATDLRNKYREKDVDYKVYKNTLMKRAFNNKGISEFDEFLSGPNAVAFSMEEATDAAKITNDYAKENEKLEIKAGFIDGQLLDVDGVIKLAKLPSKEELIASLIASIKSPITNLVFTTKNMVDDPVRDLIHIAETLAERMEAGQEKEPGKESSSEDSQEAEESTDQESQETEAKEEAADQAEEKEDQVEDKEETSDQAEEIEVTEE